MQIDDIVAMLEKMAENGHAPSEGCKLFGVGYDDAFQRLRTKYIEQRFNRGDSAEKFVIGPFGSGKTHFLRQLLEISQDLGCVTSEVPLIKDLDFTKSLLVYQEIVQNLRAPNSPEHGIRGVLLASIGKIKALAPDETTAEPLLQAWVAGLDDCDFKNKTFGRVMKLTLKAYLTKDEETFTSGCRWLAGDVNDKTVRRILSTSAITKSEENLHGHQSQLSLFQFIKHAKFQGTVVGLDEAEQGLSVDKKKMQRVLSILQSGINATVDLKGGAVLIVYAVTPDIIDKMEGLPPLQQRVADPDRGFFDGQTLAPKIDLTKRPQFQDPVTELQAIGSRLAQILFEYGANRISIPHQEVYNKINEIAINVTSTDISSSNRRTMVKRVCAMLLRLYEEGVLVDPGTVDSSKQPENEV